MRQPSISAEIVEGVLYVRGATDNKSGVLAFKKTAKAFLAVRWDVPVNLKFRIEGEEEIESPNVGPWMEKKQGTCRCGQRKRSVWTGRWRSPADAARARPCPSNRPWRHQRRTRLRV
ncbi:M20/M25/M40 family metallo-hydrolase [Pelagibacterium lentulum]|uniref:M20/M25/M40 family metallo-hydrolase n=1 Tax=Pelagibacterium lentulum TaxID=2029865 RepID=UPI0013DFC870